MNTTVLKNIDADGHVLEPPDMWIDYIEPKFRDKAPRMISTANGGEKFYFCDNFTLGDGSFNLGGSGSIGARDNGQTVEDLKELKYLDARKGGFDPHARIPDMDKDGVDASFLYPTMGLFMDMVEEEAQACANARAYNRWLADYCKAYPRRLYGVGCLPMQTIEGAVEELRYCAEKLGFKGVFVRPNPYKGRPLHHKDFYPLWELAQDLGVAVGIHGGAGRLVTLGEDRFPVKEGFAVEHCVVHTFEMMAAAASFIMCGICEKFPKLRVGFLEAGGGWMLGWLDRMDRHVEDKGMNDTNLTSLPTEIFHRQCFVSYEPTEKTLGLLADALGPKNILWATDYPHPDGFWGAVKMIKRMGLRPDTEAAVLGDGAKCFYGIQ
jgi:predicted TIM-barrel fold metal-dependent hydrolase